MPNTTTENAPSGARERAEQMATTTTKRAVGTRKARKTPATNSKDEIHEVPKINFKHIKVQLIGETRYLANPFTEMSAAKISEKEEKERGAKATGKEKRLPEVEFEAILEAIRIDKNVYGIPAAALARAIDDVGMRFMGMTKTHMAGQIFVFSAIPTSSMMPIKTKGKPTMNTGWGKPNNNAGIMRFFRAQFWPWEVTPIIKYDAEAISEGSLINLLDQVGSRHGLGSWAPRKRGTNGTFRVGKVERLR